MLNGLIERSEQIIKKDPREIILASWTKARSIAAFNCFERETYWMIVNIC
jgi:hypothetical protein